MLFLTRIVKQNRVQIPSLSILGLIVSASIAIATPSKLQPVVSAPETDKPKIVRVKRDNIRVQLTQCLKDAEKVTCTFLLSSLKNNEITVWVTDPGRQKSRVIDGEGNEYNSFEILQFGAENQGVPVVRRVPIKLVLSFTKLPEKLANASLVEIGLETYGHEIPIQFRQVNFLSAAAHSNSPTKPSSGPKRPSGEPKPSDTPPEETEEEQPETPASEQPQDTPGETNTAPSPAPVQRVPKSPGSKPQGTPPTAKPAQPEQAQPDETQTDESQSDDSQTEQSPPDDSQTDKSQPQDSQTEQSQPDDAQTEEAQPEEAQPEDSQTEQSQPEDAQTEESQPEDSQTQEDSPPAPAKPASPKAPTKP